MIRKMMRYAGIVAANVLVLVVLLGAVELFYRFQEGWRVPQDPKNALWQVFRPYTMFSTTTTVYPAWLNELTGEVIKAEVTNNDLGFRDDRKFSPISVYRKSADEKVVIFTGGSAAWGVGASTNANTIAARMEHHLNQGSAGKARYSVVNLAMGSFIAYQQFVALTLYGTGFDPDWVVVMDGFNDANVGCAQSQGSFNPMYFNLMKLYMDGYLLQTRKPVLFRGRLENLLLKHSAAARGITGEGYLSLEPLVDPHAESSLRQVIKKTSLGEARDQLAFYLRAQELTAALFPKAKLMFSTQPVVNDFRGDFVDAYDHESGSSAREEAIAKREAGLEQYLEYHKEDLCGVRTAQPASTYIFVNGAFGLERLASKLGRETGRFVKYVNAGTLMPNDRTKRIPYFIDAAHLSDHGMDLLGRYYASQILRSDGIAK